MPNLPLKNGISLKAQHYQGILTTLPDIGWLEIHPENYMSSGGLDHKYLREISQHYPISMHGVGMSLGSANGVSDSHLQNLKKLIDTYQPIQVSEHVAWSEHQSTHLNDLLPLPYTNEALSVICENIDKVQATLNRTILVENPSTYIDFEHQDFSEPEFLSAIVKQTGCGLLLDINNIFVSASNNTFDPYEYLNNLPADPVGEVHLAGHSVVPLTEFKEIRIDDHSSEVSPQVWALYQHFIRINNRAFPTLVEWDTHIPSLEVLVKESKKANKAMQYALQQSSSEATYDAK